MSATNYFVLSLSPLDGGTVQPFLTTLNHDHVFFYVEFCSKYYGLC